MGVRRPGETYGPGEGTSPFDPSFLSTQIPDSRGSEYNNRGTAVNNRGTAVNNKASNPGPPGSAGAKPNTAASTEGSYGSGLFNFQDIMKKFYEWSPSEDDVAGQQLKNTFQGDFIQTVLNNQMSKDLAYTNAEIATGQMTTAAALELANQTQVMKDEFTYGMEKMGAEYDYQTKFASDASKIKMNEMALGADLTKNQTLLEGDQNRLNIAAQGVNDLNLQDTKNKGALNQINAQGDIDKSIVDKKGQQALDQIGAQGDETLKQIGAQGDEAIKQIGAQGDVDVSKIGAQGDVDKTNILTKGQTEVANIQETGKEAIKQIDAQGYLDVKMLGMKNKNALDQIGAQGSVDISKIKESGVQSREDMKQSTREDTKKQKRDSGMARSLAGMF
jgi:hypothetical protein